MMILEAFTLTLRSIGRRVCFQNLIKKGADQPVIGTRAFPIT